MPYSYVVRKNGAASRASSLHFTHFVYVHRALFSALKGPAGSGKSTFCASAMTNLQAQKRTVHLFNLDPAADSSSFEYEPSIDIRDLISLEDVMTEMNLGPNGGLLYCFEYVGRYLLLTHMPL